MLKRFLNNSRLNFLIFILALILVAGFFRFYNLNWDNGNFFHPDERNIDNAVSRISFFSQLNPGFFAYGGFSIYLYRFAGDIVSTIAHNNSFVTDWGYLNIIGRFFSALFSTLTVIPVYLLTLKIWNKKSALLASILYVLSVASIQTAHYGVTESLITLIGVTVCLLSVLLLNKLDIYKTVLTALVLGIGIASKTSAVSFLIMPFFALLLSFKKEKFLKVVFYMILLVIISFAVFTIFSPYTFLDNVKFLESMKYESGVATGTLPVVYTLQFKYTLPYVYQIQNFIWQIGPSLIFCLLGFIFITIGAIKKKSSKLFVFFIFPLIYFLYVGSWHTKFIRYMVPIIPFLLISGSVFLIYVRSKYKLLGNFLIFISLATTTLWTIAFFSIYTRPQTRIKASQWIYYNIPVDNTIINEQWDDGLPVSIGQFHQGQYKVLSLAMYDSDNADKIEYLSKNLNQADYIILNSRRIYGTLLNLKKEYPITSRYYELLFDEKLGYKKAAEFTSYPNILGFEIKDDVSEETFQVYDHPKVTIFKNEEKLTVDQFKNLLLN
jgi:hypothetical protein